MTATLADLCTSIPASIQHDTWYATLVDRARQATLARHRCTVTEHLRLRVHLARWHAWFEARPSWSLYSGTDRGGRVASLAFDGERGVLMILRMDQDAHRRGGAALREFLRETTDAPPRGDAFTAADFPAEITVLGSPQLARALAAELGEAFDAAGCTIHWMHGGEYGEAVELPLREDLRVLPQMFPFLGAPLRDYYDAYAASTASVLLLMGPPGTGKTSFIRGYLQHTRSDALVSYDPALLATDQPLSAFLSGETSVFVLEDADAMLASRERGNTLMHRLLSVGDGLVTLAGKKMIFSTNLDSPADVDPALLRAGRCFDVLRFRSLDFAESCALARAAGVPEPSDAGRGYTAAEVFHPVNHERRSLRRRTGFV
jgi:hypothetical protein